MYAALSGVIRIHRLYPLQMGKILQNRFPGHDTELYAVAPVQELSDIASLLQ